MELSQLIIQKKKKTIAVIARNAGTNPAACSSGGAALLNPDLDGSVTGERLEFQSFSSSGVAIFVSGQSEKDMRPVMSVLGSGGRDSVYFITTDAFLDAAVTEAGFLFSDGRQGKLGSGDRASKGVNIYDAFIVAVVVGYGVAVIGLTVDPVASSSDLERPVQKGVSPALAINGYDDNGSLTYGRPFHRDSEDGITSGAIRVAADHDDASSAVTTIGQISDSRASAFRASAVGITADAFNGEVNHAGSGVAEGSRPGLTS